MKSNIKIIILVAALVIVIAGAFIAYNIYKEDVGNSEKSGFQTQTGTKMTDFAFFDMDNKEVKLSDFSGKAVVINFWATWCPACISELPIFQSTYNNHKDDVQFIMLNLTDGDRETEKNVKNYISENKFTFPVFMDKMAAGAKTYSVYSIPQTIFIDKEGNIIYTHIGAISLHDLENRIKQISD